MLQLLVLALFMLQCAILAKLVRVSKLVPLLREAQGD